MTVVSLDLLMGMKREKIAGIPTFKQQKEYTPKGFVDFDLEWYSKDLVIVARAKENREWQEGPVPTMFTSLYAINRRAKNKSHFQGRINLTKILKLLDLTLLGFERWQSKLKVMYG